MASGLKKMLAQGIANEQEQLEKVANEMPKKAELAPTSSNPEPPKESLKKEVTQTPKKAVSTKTKNDKTTDLRKNKGGRPTNKERGLTSRKQYTLTLKEDDYNEFFNRARTEEVSFAKFMEKAAKEYIRNHSS